MIRHQIQKIRHEIRRRTLTVTALEAVTPKMLRISLASPELADFVSLAPDDHVKLFFKTEAGEMVMRDFTPRAFDPEKGTLTLDFALHESGPATTWAASAAVGDRLEIGGPRGSSIVPDDFDWLLLIGDETALPAMGRWVEGLRPGLPVTTLAIVAAPEERQTFQSAAALHQTWIVRDSGDDDAAQLRQALDALSLPAGDGFVWIAAEGAVARELRRYMAEDRGHPRVWMKAAGYWARGQADGGGRIED